MSSFQNQQGVPMFKPNTNKNVPVKRNRIAVKNVRAKGGNVTGSVKQARKVVPPKPPQSVASSTPHINRSTRLKVLIIETGNCHFELIPSWVYYFGKAGFDVYLRCGRPGMRDIYPTLNSQNLKYKEVKTVQPELYDVVINNTFYPFHKIGYLPSEGSSKKKGSVVHVIKSFSDKRINDDRHVLLTLANHMNDSAKRFVKRTTFLYPVFFRHIPEVPKRVLSNSSKRVFMVQGTFENNRRNYTTLVKTVKELKHRHDFVVIMMGSGGAANRIKNQLKDCGDKIKWLTGLKYDRFFDEIYKSHFVLPLVDRNSSVKSEYFKDKITSSVMMAIGHQVPMLCDTKIEEIYGLSKENCITYDNPVEFKEKFIKAIEMKQDEYDSLVSNARVVHEKWLDQSVKNIKHWFL